MEKFYPFKSGVKLSHLLGRIRLHLEQFNTNLYRSDINCVNCIKNGNGKYCKVGLV